MKIHDCLLDSKNRFGIGGTALGEMIISQNKERLWEERSHGRIDTVVIHYMSATNINPERLYDLDLLLGIFCDYGVSAHYLISRRGKIWRLVPEDKKAWHCGPSIMPDPDNRTGVNEFSIGIELAATQQSGFTDSQYDTLCKLCLDIEKRLGKKPHYAGHDQIAGKRAVDRGLRKEAKTDPGPLFDWDYFTEKMAALRSAPTV